MRVFGGMTRYLAATALALALSACSAPAPDSETSPAPDAAPSAAATATTPAPTASATAGARTLTLEGLGKLRIGEAVAADSGWTLGSGQTSDACLVYTSPDYPGAYAIVEEGKVRRISIGQRSDVKLVEGIGVGSTRAEVDANLPGFRETPHKYVEGGVDLTAPNAPGGDSAVRFEMGADGKVSIMHVGTEPVLGYVEGCA